MKKVLVCGAGGFIGGHLVKKLKKERCWIRGVDLKAHEYCSSAADEFIIGDLTDQELVREVLDNLLLPAFAEVGQGIDIISGIAVVDRNQDNLVVSFTVINEI